MEGKGKLRVRVYTAQAKLPIEGATVVVAREGAEGRYELLSVQSTDSSGLVRPVEVEAPAVPSSGSLPGQLPASNCVVWAEHPNYIMLMVHGVQIFSGVETVQNMDLVPLAEWQYSLQRNSHLHIQPQDL